jgi:hypothetical protein
MMESPHFSNLALSVRSNPEVGPLPFIAAAVCERQVVPARPEVVAKPACVD